MFCYATLFVVVVVVFVFMVIVQRFELESRAAIIIRQRANTRMDVHLMTISQSGTMTKRYIFILFWGWRVEWGEWGWDVVVIIPGYVFAS